MPGREVSSSPTRSLSLDGRRRASRWPMKCSPRTRHASGPPTSTRLAGDKNRTTSSTFEITWKKFTGTSSHLRRRCRTRWHAGPAKSIWTPISRLRDTSWMCRSEAGGKRKTGEEHDRGGLVDCRGYPVEHYFGSGAGLLCGSPEYGWTGSGLHCCRVEVSGVVGLVHDVFEERVAGGYF